MPPGPDNRLTRLAGHRVKKELAGIAAVLELEQIEQRAGHRIERGAADAAQVPIVLDELKNRSLVGYRMVDKVRFGVPGDHQQRKTLSIAAPAVGSAGRGLP